MLMLENTANLAGISICGDYYDLNSLVDAFHEIAIDESLGNTGIILKQPRNMAVIKKALASRASTTPIALIGERKGRRDLLLEIKYG